MANGSTAANKETFPTVNPFDQETWAIIPQATQGDVELAIDAARRAFRNEMA